ncbi:MAG TPA: L,D-transpeptidase, partial [Mycobacteriales bacterium]|nr:L,D-transpeptidase [Mycobacteriales bacterium]
MRTAYRSFAALFAAAALSLLSIPASTTPAAARGEFAPYHGDVSPGTIIVRTEERRLYLVLGQGRALVYPVGVGRAGMQWSGHAFIESKRIRPAWGPPPEIKRENPNLPDVIPGGAPNNPMGVAALVLNGDKYAIHGTNNPNSIGHFASH